MKLTQDKVAAISKRIIQRLEADILDRAGLKWEWRKIEPDVMLDLKDAWREIIEEEYLTAKD